MPQLQLSFDRYLNIRSASTPVWLDGGERLAFLSDITGTPQIWSQPLDGGWPDQLTFFQEKVWTLGAAPGGKRLICTRDIGGNERYQMFLVSSDGVEVRRISESLDAIYHFGAWARDGIRIAYTSNQRNGTHFDVYIQDVDAGNGQMVFQTAGNFRVLDWSPDGKHLILVNEVSSAHQILFLLDVESNVAKPLTSLDEPVNNLQVHWKEDDFLFLLTNQGREFLGLAQMQIENGHVTYLLEDLQHDVDALGISPSGKTVAFVASMDGYSQLGLYSCETGQRRNVPDFPAGVIGEPKFSPDGSHVAVSVQTPQENLNIWVAELNNGPSPPRKLTQSSLAGIPQRSFVAPALIHYETFDGRSIPGFFYSPQDMQPPFPCILYVHGGPATQTIPDFDPRFQFFLSRGYAILAPNVRGSRGYGKTYTALDDVELRMDSVTDLKHAVDWLGQQDEVDMKRIAIYGRSYGGFMVLSAITTFPDLWAAAIDVVGIANWVTFLENTSSWRRAHREQEYGSLEHDRKFLASISPIYEVDRIQCPLLVIHGANDPRVPVSEADQIVKSLQERDHPVDYLRYEDEGHKIAKLNNRIDSFTKMGEFLDRYLK